MIIKIEDILESIKIPIAIFNEKDFNITNKNNDFSSLFKGISDNLIDIFLKVDLKNILSLPEKKFEYNCTLKKIKNVPFEFHINVISDEFSIIYGFNNMKIKENEYIMNSFSKMINDFNLLKEKQMKDSLEMASSIQKSLLPLPNLKVKNFSISSFYQSAVSIGGDWYNYYVNEKEAHIYIGDITGHGIGSALLAGVITGIYEKHLLKVINEKSDFPNPTLILNDFNKIILKLSNQKLVMTMLALVISKEKMNIISYSAAHNPPLLLKRSKLDSSGQIEIKLIGNSGSKLGYSENLNLTEQNISIEAGDILFAYTDGIIEGLSNGEEFGIKRLKDTLKNLFMQKIPVEEIMLQVKETILSSFDSRALEDDISAIAVEVLN
ncbi:PP2C family protein-serine/threonine phosphatase [Fluviispira multicolorata]|uniref:SpoIIE family protein phosphatase n=1 Tax=Fluviispira multicolorata TaxID=2654512 RepID=A0A833N1K9_9BACT|nr:SpoIIE family protein phosphatase [Fluviispira multicolorata]KAB8030920.1 SpoIIE family protein phosphatase [Fluviispira multicolorata]